MRRLDVEILLLDSSENQFTLVHYQKAQWTLVSLALRPSVTTNNINSLRSPSSKYPPYDSPLPSSWATALADSLIRRETLAMLKKSKSVNPPTGVKHPQEWTRASELAGILYFAQRFDSNEKNAVAEIRDLILRKIEEPDSHAALEYGILVFSHACQFLPGYATLSAPHLAEMLKVLNVIHGYLEDDSLGRPLNFLLLATPGSGKSQLVKSIFKKFGDKAVGYVSFNMATMQSKDDLGRVLDVARNHKIDHKLPLIFLDEFDSHDSHYPLLLPLLWDGELGLAHRELRLGRSVFFLAGSRKTLPDRLNNARAMVASRSIQSDDSKLVDLISRINGTVIEVPSLDVGRQSMPDKVMLAMHLLRVRFPNCDTVPWTLLWFIAKAKFRYEARSIATLINAIPMRRRNRKEDASTLPNLTEAHLRQLPLSDPVNLKQSELAFHLIDDGGEQGITELWKTALGFRRAQQLRFKPLNKVEPLPEWYLAAEKQRAARPAK